MKRTRIYTYGGKPARRNLTVAELVSLKGKTTLSQTCPERKRRRQPARLRESTS